jgi:hypothetical protein
VTKPADPTTPESAQEKVETDVIVKQEPEEGESVTKIEETPSEVKENIPPPERPPLKKIEILPPPEHGILVLLGFRYDMLPFMTLYMHVSCITSI